jgi:hypothetical protein
MADHDGTRGDYVWLTVEQEGITGDQKWNAVNQKGIMEV